MRLWEIEGTELSRGFVGHKGEVWAAAYSPDGKSIVSGGADKLVHIWDAASGKERRTLPGHASAVTCVLYSHDGKSILSCSGDKTLKLWNAAKLSESGAHLHRGHTVPLSLLCRFQPATGAKSPSISLEDCRPARHGLGRG